jgi:hypothetical protein
MTAATGEQAKNKVKIELDNHQEHVAPGTYVVSVLKGLIGVPADKDLDQVIEGVLTTLNDNSSVTIRGGEIFFSHVLRAVYPDAVAMSEGAIDYVYLPRLPLSKHCGPQPVEGLIRPGPGPDGYTTRLFLSSPCPGRGQNWTVHQILAKTWHTFSFNNVPADLRLVEILANHLRVLQ